MTDYEFEKFVVAALLRHGIAAEAYAQGLRTPDLSDAILRKFWEGAEQAIEAALNAFLDEPSSEQVEVALLNASTAGSTITAIINPAARNFTARHGVWPGWFPAT